MALSIDSQDFLLAILRGNLYASTPLPLALCERLEKQCEGQVIFERPSKEAQFCDVYSPPGWANELLRRAYVASFDRPAPPKPRNKELVRKEMMEAINAGDMERAVVLKKELGL